MTPASERGPALPELALVWSFFALATVAVFVTYARFPASTLYHVSGSGLEGGASRALVHLNFPVALAALAVCVVLLDRVETTVERGLALAAVVLCAAVFWPGVVDQANFDARPVNAVAALGVALALALTIRVGGRGLLSVPERRRGDLLRGAAGVVLVALALPWLAAAIGFYLDGVPGVGSVYLTGALRAEPHVAGLHHAVHHGDHHGMDGVLLVAAVLVLSRLVPSLRARFLRGLLGAYLALMLAYGVGNIANDFWLEQVVKRGWATWEVPDVTTVKATAAWAVIVAAAIVLWAIFVRPLVREPNAPATGRDPARATG